MNLYLLWNTLGFDLLAHFGIKIKTKNVKIHKDFEL